MSLTLHLSGTESILRAQFSPPIELKSEGEIALLSLICWNTFPNVDSSNQNFYYNDGKSDKVIKIPTGSYEIENIEDYIRDSMKLEHRKNPLTENERILLGEHPIFLYGNRQTLKSEMICRYAVDFKKPNNIATILGFSEKIIPAFTRVESDRTINILSTEVIRVECNISESSFQNGKPVHIVHEFFPQVPVGFKILEIPKNLIYYKLNSQIISEIEIKITDQDHNLLNFRGEKIHVRLHIRSHAYDN